MDGHYNLRNPAVKRLMKEASEMKDASALFHAQPLEDNLFEWHFTIRGPSDSEFNDGIYHGRIILPPEYPMKPPSIILLTPNGRFEVNKKICLSISGFHPESWQPSWSIRTALLAIIGFMPTHGNGAIGSLDYSPEERRQLAKKSCDWACASCGKIRNILLPVTDVSSDDIKEAKEMASQINFQGEKEKTASTSDLPSTPTANSAAVSAGGDNSAPLADNASPAHVLGAFSPWMMYHQAGMQPLAPGVTPSSQSSQWPSQVPAAHFPMSWPPGWPPSYTSVVQQPSLSTFAAGVPGLVQNVSSPQYSHGSISSTSVNRAFANPSQTDTPATSNVFTTTADRSSSLPVAPSASPSTSVDSTRTFSSTTNEGLRQRVVPTVTETRQPAEITRRPPHRNDHIIVGVMIIISIVLVFLVLRKIGLFGLIA